MTRITVSTKLDTERLKLTPIKLEDIDDVFHTMNCEKTANIISFLTWPMTKQQAAYWCERAVRGVEMQNEFFFIARSKQDRSPVGCIAILLCDNSREGEVAYLVSENKQRQGFATEMLKAIIELAFNVLDLSKLIASTSFENPISQKILEKQGFQMMGYKDISTAKGTILKCRTLALEL